MYEKGSPCRNATATMIALGLTLAPLAAHADTYVWDMLCSEDQISNSGVGDGSTDSTATGTANVRYDTATQRLMYDVSWNGLESLLEKIHVHGPALLGASNPNHVFDVFSDLDDITAAGVDRTTDSIKVTDSFFNIIVNSGGVGLPTIEDNAQVMIDEMAYVNIHTTVWPGGEIRCQFVQDQLLVGTEQSKDQQKCTNSMDKGLSKVSAAQGKHICGCIKDHTKGKLGGLLSDCVSTPASKVGDAQAKVSADFTKRCTGNDKNGDPKFPAYGVTSDANVNNGGEAMSTGVTTAIFGGDLDTGVDDGSNPDTGKCQSATIKASKKCLDTLVKEFDKCVKGDLKGKVGLTIADEFGIEECVGRDLKGKIAKACDADTGKVRSTLDKKCGGVDLVSAFSGCGVADAASTAQCIDAQARCLTCAVLNGVSGISVDCDLFDDGQANTSCIP